jgi:xanthine dehydrogenase YagS FAD-binding subunit
VKAFAYVNATSEKEAVAALSPERGKVLPLAGGMDLLGLMKDYIAQPDTLVNVKNLPSTIAVPAQGLTMIGAAARVADVPPTTRLQRPTLL